MFIIYPSSVHMYVLGVYMLEPILGSLITEKALIFILERGNGYLREISQLFDIPATSLVKPLENLEAGGVLFSKEVGRTRVYAFNPRCFYVEELKALLSKAFQYYPNDLKEKLINNRRRPRRKGKPL